MWRLCYGSDKYFKTFYGILWRKGGKLILYVVSLIKMTVKTAGMLKQLHIVYTKR